MQEENKNSITKSAEEKVEDLKKAIQEIGFDINETEDGIEILQRNEK